MDLHKKLDQRIEDGRLDKEARRAECQWNFFDALDDDGTAEFNKEAGKKIEGSVNRIEKEDSCQ
jgi:hypothetical protein